MQKLLKPALLALFIFSHQAWSAEEFDADTLLKQVDEKLSPPSYEMYRKLINIEPDGKRKEFVLYSVKKGQDKMLALFLDPASERGRSTLRLGDNQWLYIPNVGRPLRITSLQSVVGGVFNNSDIMQLDFHVEYSATLLEETADQWLLELKARHQAVAYDRLKMWVDKASQSPLTIEAYASSGMLIKTLRYSEMKDFGHGIKRPSQLQTDSPLFKGHKSVMLFSGIKPRAFADEVFSLSFMPRVGELRQ